MGHFRFKKKKKVSQIKDSNKQFHVAGDFHLNVLDHKRYEKIQQFLKIISKKGMIPIKNKPTRVTYETVTAIDHILTNFQDSNP